ncbi:hypothetical protein ACFY2R_05930 [Micromonospora olivasterospora]|uniref:Uncharacterized protein n=1 Tax=Micromonospora olivasterospora TaxID=1880 RepID=A0A562II84_MICOL|nr:hypothetical protein [Micromonospora olivasterospora]TWH70538.1 hypothetical protein JD77_05563 [Micromonospora olivasterospora]
MSERVRTFDGPLRQGADLERSIDELWFYNDPAHYGSLVLRCGWPAESFQRWLGARMRDVLLP